jgi:peptidoglycan hydrolase CwlO-like protein
MGEKQTQLAMELIEKLQEGKSEYGCCIEELIETVQKVVNRVKENQDTIEELKAEIQENERELQGLKNKGMVNYEIDEDGFINLANKKA